MKKLYLKAPLFIALFSSFITFAAPPNNDDCVNATALQFNIAANGTTIGATQSMAGASCGNFTGDANDDVWYKFTAVSLGSAIIKLSNASSSFDAVLNAYTGSCGALNLISCADAAVEGEDETMIVKNLTPGQVIYVRVYGFGGAGTEGTFNVTLSGSALPVTIRDFSVESKGGRNFLFWSTVTEQNTKKFEVLHSTDGLKFKTIGETSSKAFNGVSDKQLTYNFIDNSAVNGNNYYKLKQVNTDDEVAFSNVVAVKVDKAVNAKAEIYPNPVKGGQLKIRLNSSVISGDVSVVVTDISGNTVLQRKITINSDEQSLNVSSLPKGNYFIKAVSDKGVAILSERFFKQ